MASLKQSTFFIIYFFTIRIPGRENPPTVTPVQNHSPPFAQATPHQFSNPLMYFKDIKQVFQLGSRRELNSIRNWNLKIPQPLARHIDSECLHRWIETFTTPHGESENHLCSKLKLLKLSFKSPSDIPHDINVVLDSKFKTHKYINIHVYTNTYIYITHILEHYKRVINFKMYIILNYLAIRC